MFMDWTQKLIKIWQKSLAGVEAYICVRLNSLTAALVHVCGFVALKPLEVLKLSHLHMLICL